MSTVISWAYNEAFLFNMTNQRGYVDAFIEGQFNNAKAILKQCLDEEELLHIEASIEDYWDYPISRWNLPEKAQRLQGARFKGWVVVIQTKNPNGRVVNHPIRFGWDEKFNNEQDLYDFFYTSNIPMDAGYTKIHRALALAAAKWEEAGLCHWVHDDSGWLDQYKKDPNCRPPQRLS